MVGIYHLFSSCGDEIYIQIDQFGLKYRAVNQGISILLRIFLSIYMAYKLNLKLNVLILGFN